MHTRHQLNLFDATCLIVGIIVGSGIYETPAQVAAAVGHPRELFLLWALGGLVSLCGALCYAELASAYPESGGDVVYLRHAYGPLAGFLFGWLQTFVARPGDISLMALVFAHYVQVLVNPQLSETPAIWPALTVVILLTVLNIVGLRVGKAAQNVLTVIKLGGLFAIMGIAVFAQSPAPVPVNPGEPGISRGVALILILFTFGGWNEMVYVASEVHQPRRNVWRALVLGSVSVTLIYLLMNAAYLHSLGLVGMANSQAIATDAVARVLPRGSQMFVAAVIAVSAAGAINGLVLTGARITGAMRTYPAFRSIGAWHPRLQTPVRALVLECVISLLIISIARTFVNALIYTSAAVYTFYLATSLSTLVLRVRFPDLQRPFRVPWYPLPLIIFAGACCFTIYSAVTYKPDAAWVCFAILGVGAVVYVIQSGFNTVSDASS